MKARTTHTIACILLVIGVLLIAFRSQLPATLHLAALIAAILILIVSLILYVNGRKALEKEK